MSINNQQLQRYAQPTRIVSDLQDIDTPFSFQAWIKTHNGIIPGQEYALYNQYLINWYSDRSTKNVDKNIQIKINYLNLLRQLQLFFTNQEVESWYNSINLDNDKEVLLAIPYFAKKLKDIALYYLKLRDDVKKAKLKYNLVGTETGINSQLQEFLLTNYTKKPNSFVAIPASVWRSIPELSAVQETINIEIDELYDTFQYLDHSPSLPVSAYYEINSAKLENYFTSLGLALTSTEWIYKTGVFEVSGNAIIDAINVSEEITNKYINNDKYTSFFYNTSTSQDFYFIPIETGNNYFLYPYGSYPSNITDLPRYKPLPLSAAGLELVGTGGNILEGSDTIFIKTARGIKGAWLRYIPFYETEQTMQAALEAKTTTSFRYPFPGYGLSAEGLNWTGYGLVTNPLFYYQPNNVKKAIENVYWSTFISLTSHEPKKINSTSLIENKAYANQQYEFADKMRIWPTAPLYSSSSYSGDINEVWLYKMSQTDISIAPNSNTTIVWPYGSLDNTRSYPAVPEDITKVCLPTPLSSIQFSYAIASDSLSSADLFLKIQNYQTDPAFATEGAWLSSVTKYYPELKITMPLQPGLNFVATPGNFTQFVWQGTDNTDVNDVFISINHQPDCLYKTTPNTTYKDHTLCNCRRVLFTPFGHPGYAFTDNASFSDFIIEDPFTYNLNFSEWTDSDGNPALQSDSFAWFKTNSKIGFGDGYWITGLRNIGLKLKTGKSYLYYRQNITDETTQDNSFPEYCVRYSYNNYNNNNFKWIQASKDVNGNWTSINNIPSKIILYPGENLIYSRLPGTTFLKANSALSTQIINENRGSIWTNYDYLTVPDRYNPSNTVLQQFVLSYPQFSTIPIGGSINDQYPEVNSLKDNFVKVIAWRINDPLGVPYTFSSQALAITPLITGVYTFSVTAMSAATMPPRTAFINASSFYYTNTALYIFNDIPSVTAISGTTVIYPTTAFLIPAPGFVLNTPLYGWDYNTSTYTTNTILGDYGAKPFWATSATIKNEYTGYKGINAWGNYLRVVDGYNIISQPEISDISLNTGSRIEYDRVANTDMVWSQSLKQQVNANKNVWSTLNFNTTSVSNLNVLLNNNPLELIVYPTSAESTLQLESIVDNKPVEIFYNAINPFTWQISATPVDSQTIYTTITGNKITNIKQPWANLPSRYYPNIAILPTVKNLSSTTNFGGFFVPQNLGATQYINKNYTINNILTSLALTGIYEDPQKFIPGRGLTKQDQLTPFSILFENNTWLKESPIAGPIAGTINKNIFKEYQKFIPYQSRYESNFRYRYGLTTPSSLQTPWTGPTDTDWKDLQNYPVSYTGELNVNKWSDSQILKQFSLQLDNWVTDIFGNQYGLYKSLSGVQPSERKNTPGQIWIRKNSQKVLPAAVALSGVFDTYKSISLYNELTGSEVFEIDVFFDTLYTRTARNITFDRLIYDYNNDYIFSLADESRCISLGLPVTTNLSRELSGVGLQLFASAGDTWFFPNKKQVIQSICSLSGGVLRPELYLYDLNSIKLTKAFPLLQNNINTVNALSSLNILSINPPLLTYNSLKKEFILTLQAFNDIGEYLIIELLINDFSTLELKDIVVYSSCSLNNNLPPAISQSLTITQSYLSSLNIQLTANSSSVTYTGLSLPSWVSLTNTGLFTGSIPTSGIYSLPFVVNNNVGSTYYALTINAI